ncbi:ABC transporter permease [Streptomyces phyllanthi]|uniref:ABC transporter permease n=1 Tax=Streptomyces phyllanthi TaxID=1803180 RepID=A0A5N8WDB0_9ACTN|nr:ABC transporter permease [Streptomyces phyllanthi]MPY45450.1 ABC transporter permease [Streptomyces phyllanthi]
MTAVSAAPAEASAHHRSLRPRGLLWAMLHLHRAALLFWLLLIAVAGGALLWAYGPGADGAWAEYRMMRCAYSGPNRTCDYTGLSYDVYSRAVSLGSLTVTLVPFLAALWAGAALIGRELESGTAELAWTQSVTPTRWLLAKLTAPAVLLVLGTSLLVLLHRLVWTSNDELRRWMNWDWYVDSAFRANGVVGIAYALLGLAAGALAALLTRRSLPALGIGGGCLAVIVYGLTVLRPHLWPVVTVTRENESPPATGMPVAEGALTSAGARVPPPVCGSRDTCLAERDIVAYYRDFHPSSHFWPLQLVETGIVLALAAVVTGVSFWLLRRRTGAAV